MALHRINRVLIRDVRSWRGDHEFTFDQDLTVLYGPNGSGKSSLWTGIVLGLLYKIRSGPVVEAIRSIGGGAGHPYVEIDFTADGVQYRIEKAFASGTAATARLLNLNDGAELSQGDAAVIECRNLVTGSDDQAINADRSRNLTSAFEASTKGQIVDLILPKQGQLNKRPEENEALSSVGLEEEEYSQNNALNSMIAWAEGDKKAIKSSERANASGTLMDATRSHEVIASEEARLNDLSNNLQTLIREVNELEIEMEEEETEDDIQERIDTLRQEAEDHQVSREAAENAVREADGVVQPLQTQHTQRVQLREEAQNLATQNTQFSGQMIERREAHEKAEGDLETRRGHLEEVKSKLDTLNEWITFVQRQEAVVSQRQELVGLEADRDQLNETIDRAAEIQADLNAIILATDEQWDRIRDIAQEIAAIRGAADAWSITEFSPGKEHRIFIDGEEIEEAPKSVNTSIEVRDAKGNAKLRVENTTSLSKIQEFEEEERSIFSALSVEGTLELRTRQIEFDELTGKLTVENSRIEDLNNRMAMDERIEQIAQLTALLDSSVDEPETDRPEEGDWVEMVIPLEGERNSVESLKKESAKALQEARDKLTEIGGQLDLLTSQITEKEEEISAHIEAFGEDDALQALLAEAQVRLKEAQKVAEPLTEARDANEEQKRTMAQNLQNQMAGEQNTRTRISNLQATIRDRRTIGGLEELSNFSAKREALDGQVSALENEYLALQNLEVALNSVRAANIEAIRPRVENTIQNGASYVFGRDVQINLGDDGFPQAVQHVQGQAIPFEQESFGTQEQLNLIYRIALAGIIAEDEGHGLCIVLDDPFGDTDVGRRQRMMEWMGAQLGQAGHQLILLTCRGTDFNGFGHHDDIRQH
jgi:DNA repair exonuclease SbcCD ATPase subunit